MAISFSSSLEDGYFVSKYVGKIFDEELLAAYRDFFQTGNSASWLNELVDLSEANLVEVSSNALRELSLYIDMLLRQRGITQIHTAIFAPRDLEFGISRVYEAMSDCSPESVRVFRDFGEAKKWLIERRRTRQ